MKKKKAEPKEEKRRIHLKGYYCMKFRKLYFGDECKKCKVKE